MHAASASPRSSARTASRSPANMIAVFARHQVELEHFEVIPGIRVHVRPGSPAESGLPAANQRRPLRRDAPSDRRCADGASANQDQRSEVTIRIAHVERLDMMSGSGGDAFALQPSQR